MEHIINSETEGIDFTRYSLYLESVRDKLPPHIYAFASDSRYFDLSSPSSLHDAWVESLTVKEVASGARQEVRRMVISLCLLGPFHDRRIWLRYTGVARYTFTTPPVDGEPRAMQIAHGDLLTHEIRLGGKGLFIHEFLFERGGTFLIECADIQHSEEGVSNEE